jgi:hypothetical protein
MFALILFTLALSDDAEQDFQLYCFLGLVDEAKEYVKVFTDWLSGLMETPFFLRLHKIRQYCVKIRNDYIHNHQTAYDTHQALVQEARKRWDEDHEDGR